MIFTFEINKNTRRLHSILLRLRQIYKRFHLHGSNGKLKGNSSNSNNKLELRKRFGRFEKKIRQTTSIYCDRILINVEEAFPNVSSNHSIIDKTAATCSTIEFDHRISVRRLKAKRRSNGEKSESRENEPEMTPLGLVSRIRRITNRSFRVPANG